MARRNYKRARRGLSDYVAAFTLFAIVAIAAAWFENYSAEQINEEMIVVDGDSLKSGDRRFRLVGIDAPELSQQCLKDGLEYPCGRKARDHLRTLIGNKAPPNCSGLGIDKYGRTLVECVAGKTNINREMVVAGWAISYSDFGAEETDARTAKRGLWAGEFERPNDWRAKYGGLIEAEHSVMLLSWWRRLSSLFD